MNTNPNPIRIRSRFNQNVTILSNDFLDRFLPGTNGEFIKVYLLLLRTLSGGKNVITLSGLADQLNCTENDVLRALRYFENEGALALTVGEDGRIEELSFPEDTGMNAHDAYEVAKPSDVTAERITELKEQREIKELLFEVENYLKKPLTYTELQRLFYFYDTLHFSTELIEYLVEYCVGNNHPSLRYMEKVALDWHRQGITDPHGAKLNTMNYHREYYDILKALGLDNHNPVEKEIQFMKKWLEDYHFSMDIIREACTRTVVGTGKPTMNYADGILTSWHKSGVRSMEDIRRLDEQHQEAAEKRKKAAGSTGRRTKPAAAFDYSSQRRVDSDLESRLLKKTREKYADGE